MLSHVKALGGGSVVVGLAVFGSFVAGGEPAGPAALYALGVTFLTLTFVAVGAVTSQLFGTRRRAAGTAGAVLGVSYVIRMVADGTKDAAWLRWASPLGWVENLEAFAANRLLPLVPLVITPPILFAVAVALDRRRDTDEGIIRDSGTSTARLRLLRSPLGFRCASASADSSDGGSDCSHPGSSSERSPRPSSTSSPPTPTSPTSPPSSASHH